MLLPLRSTGGGMVAIADDSAPASRLHQDLRWRATCVGGRVERLDAPHHALKVRRLSQFCYGDHLLQFADFLLGKR